MLPATAWYLYCSFESCIPVFDINTFERLLSIASLVLCYSFFFSFFLHVFLLEKGNKIVKYNKYIHIQKNTCGIDINAYICVLIVVSRFRLNYRFIIENRLVLLLLFLCVVVVGFFSFFLFLSILSFALFRNNLQSGKELFIRHTELVDGLHRLSTCVCGNSVYDTKEWVGAGEVMMWCWKQHNNKKHTNRTREKWKSTENI